MEATLELLKLATMHKKIKPMHFISSVDAHSEQIYDDPEAAKWEDNAPGNVCPKSGDGYP